MKLCHLLTICCFLLAACSSSEEITPASKQATLKHLQQDQIADHENQADGFSVSLIPEPLIAAENAKLIVTGCREQMSYTWFVNGVPIPGATSNQLSAVNYNRGDGITTEVTCGESKAVAKERVQNSPPAISAVKFASQVIIPGTDLTVIPEADDADGDLIEYIYQWSVNGEYLDSISGPTLPGKYVSKSNEIMLEVTPADQFDDGEVFEGIGFAVPNSPPSINSQPPQSFSAKRYEYQLDVSDPDDEQLTFALEKAPAGMEISPTGFISWPLENVSAGQHEIAIVVEDTDGLQSRQAYTLNLSLPE